MRCADGLGDAERPGDLGVRTSGGSPDFLDQSLDLEHLDGRADQVERGPDYVTDEIAYFVGQLGVGAFARGQDAEREQANRLARDQGIVAVHERSAVARS